MEMTLTIYDILAISAMTTCFLMIISTYVAYKKSIMQAKQQEKLSDLLKELSKDYEIEILDEDDIDNDKGMH